MFTLPQADADAVEGNTDDKPIHLYGVSKIDFERLLNFMYPLYGCHCLTLLFDLMHV